nr:MAG: maturation protein [Hangzhou steitz-like virus 6]
MSQAMSAMLPSLQGETNLVNFLIELKDFKHIAQTIMSKASLLQNAKAFMGIRTHNSKKLSSAYLQWKFAWRPLFNDLYNLWHSYEAYLVRLQEVVRRRNTPQQRYWGRNLDVAIGNDTLILGGTTSSGTVGSFTGSVNYRIEEYDPAPARYSATMRYRYTMPNWLVSQAYNSWRGEADALGLNRNPATIWNAVPFTFIVDWVVNVGQFLERLRVDNIDLRSRTEVLDFCHSVKARRKLRFRVMPLNKWPGGGLLPAGPDYQTYAYGETSYYCRRVAVPNLYNIQISGLNATELALGGALLQTRYGYRH